MNETKKQNYELFYNTIKSLSYSKGRYGRMLRDIDNLSEHDLNELITQLPDFKEPVDVVIFIEQ